MEQPTGEERPEGARGPPATRGGSAGGESPGDLQGEHTAPLADLLIKGPPELVAGWVGAPDPTCSLHAWAMQASQGLLMSHPFPPHECGGEGVGQAKGRGRVKPPPEQSLRRLLLVVLNESRLEETAVPCLRKEIGRPSEEDAGPPKALKRL